MTRMKRQQHFQLNLSFSYHELLLIISLYGNVHQNSIFLRHLTNNQILNKDDLTIYL